MNLRHCDRQGCENSTRCVDSGDVGWLILEEYGMCNPKHFCSFNCLHQWSIIRMEERRLEQEKSDKYWAARFAELEK
jgi:hypothetical protein